MTYKPKLIEVALPLSVINKFAAAEGSICVNTYPGCSKNFRQPPTAPPPHPPLQSLRDFGYIPATDLLLRRPPNSLHRTPSAAPS